MWRAPTWQRGGRERRRDRLAGDDLGHVGSYAAVGSLRRRHAERGQAGGGPEQSAGDTRHRVLSPGVRERKKRAAAANTAAAGAASPCGAAPEKPAPPGARGGHVSGPVGAGRGRG